MGEIWYKIFSYAAAAAAAQRSASFVQIGAWKAVAFLARK
jgi:hypothetical protein